MRFAGQRIRATGRAPYGGIGKFREGNYRAEDGSSPYANPTGISAMTAMPEVNAARFTKTAQPNMSNPDFAAPGKKQEPDFTATLRI